MCDVKKRAYRCGPYCNPDDRQMFVTTLPGGEAGSKHVAAVVGGAVDLIVERATLGGSAQI